VTAFATTGRVAPPEKRFGAALRAQIDSLNPWFYELEIGGEPVTPGIDSVVPVEHLVQRHAYRQPFLLDAVLKRYDFTGKRILDVACNCGYWSSQYAGHGAVRFLGVEARPRAVQQGWIYWQHGEFLPEGAYEFLQGHVMDETVWKAIRAAAPFDFTLCAGILYHVSNYRALLQNIAAVTREAILVDTRVETVEKPVDEPGDLKFNGVPAAGSTAITKTVPRLERLLEHLHQLGFTTERIQPAAKIPDCLCGPDDYNRDARVTILCRRD
jgi:2-polyprenyl-3-methyl-5-hydroxy-6-metoxy-1,4-benzoquinol methylase